VPFTPAHAVVALPFVRTPLLPAAIAVGAMAPDLPLFVRGTPLTYQLTHTSLVTAVLVALVLLVLWYAVLRPAARELSPLWLARRLPARWDAAGLAVWHEVRATRSETRGAMWSRAVASAALVTLSLTLGVLSHVVWDAFTHDGRWGVRLVPALEENWGPLLGYKWLQYGSGVVGVAILVVFGGAWLRRRTAENAVRVLPDAVRVFWWASLPLSLLVGWTLGIAIFGPLTGEFTVAHLAYLVLPPACAAWGLVTIVLAVVVQLRRRATAPTYARRSRRA
jgi:hypothetical protein